MSGNEKLEELPDIFNNMKALKQLDVSNCGLKCLPQRLGS